MSATTTLDLVNQNLSEEPLRVSDGDTVRITVSYAVVGIAQGIADGKSVTDALNQWIEVADDAVSVYKAHPQQCELTLTGKFGSGENSLPNELLILVAQYALNLSKKAQSLAAWLDACAKHHDEAPAKIEIGFLQSLLHTVDSNVTQNNEQKEENELLLLQLQQVQEELEQIFLAKKELEKKFASLTANFEQVEKELAASQAELAQSEAELKRAGEAAEIAKKEAAEASKSQGNSQQVDDLTEENELLLLQLQQVQEELEHYFIRCKELEAGGASTSQSQTTPTTYTQPNIVTPKQPDVTDSPAWRVVAPFYTKLDKLIRHMIFKRQAKVVKKSKLFDKKWYSQTYADVKGFKGGAALHYVAHGAAEGRDPGPEFSSERYWAMNPDVAENGTNPLVHYELFGKNEGRYY